MPPCRTRGCVGDHAPARRLRALSSAAGDDPYYRLERTEVEASQIFTAKRVVPAPQAVPGLGIEADWFPVARQLMATDGIRLITLTVGWRGATQARRRALAEAVTRTYLRRRR